MGTFATGELRAAIAAALNGSVIELMLGEIVMTMENYDIIEAKALSEAVSTLVKAGVSYDFFISKILWGLSLYLENGSFKIQNFPRWHRMSDAAAALQKVLPPGDWKKEIRFEHARPLNDMYAIAKSDRDSLTVGKLLHIIGEYPPVVITKKEDQLIHKSFKSTGRPEERYAEIKLSFPLRSDRWKTHRWA